MVSLYFSCPKDIWFVILPNLVIFKVICLPESQSDRSPTSPIRMPLDVFNVGQSLHTAISYKATTNSWRLEYILRAERLKRRNGDVIWVIFVCLSRRFATLISRNCRYIQWKCVIIRIEKRVHLRYSLLVEKLWLFQLFVSHFLL